MSYSPAVAPEFQAVTRYGTEIKEIAAATNIFRRSCSPATYSRRRHPHCPSVIRVGSFERCGQTRVLTTQGGAGGRGGAARTASHNRGAGSS